MALDPILLEILQHKVQAIAEEMAITLARTARSTYVKDAADFGTSLATVEGKFFAYPAALGVSGFLDLDAGPAIRAVPGLVPGDVIITNHPYQTGGLSTHMPDLQLIRPCFVDGEILCFAWDFIHSADIGGGVPSSISPRFTELFQEGLQIPPIKLVKAGRLNQDFVKLYRANCRVPELNLGDISAMLAALEIGEKRVAELVEQHGRDAFLQAQSDLVGYGRAKARAVQRRIPDGVYSFADYMDDDFATKIPMRVRCEMTVADGHIHLDFKGSDPQVATAYNVPTGGIRHPWLTLKLMHLIASYDPSVPLNYGLFEDISVHVPKGSFLNPHYPAAVGVRHATAIRINDALIGCMAQAVPDMIPAPSGGTVVPTVLAEPNDKTGTREIMVIQSLVGGTGARQGADGVDGRDSGLANLFNTPLERTEADANVIIETYALRPDSGGPGQWRGGTGLDMSFRILKPGTAVLGRGLERFVFRPWGISGGMPGETCRVILNRGTSAERDLGKLDMFVAEEGDAITILTAGGGGCGDPFRREAKAVLRDVRVGFVSIERARIDYGVVIEHGEIDQAATQSLRSSRPSREGFGFGPERLAWESVFSDELTLVMNERLLAMPAQMATGLRRRIINEVVPGLDRVGEVSLESLIRDPSAMRKKLAELIDSELSPAIDA